MPSRPPLHRPYAADPQAYNRQRRSRPGIHGKIESWRGSRRWRKCRAIQLGRKPLCERCEEQGRTTPATQVHHIEGAHQRPDLFWQMDNWMSVCARCHAEIERG